MAEARVMRNLFKIICAIPNAHDMSVDSTLAKLIWKLSAKDGGKPVTCTRSTTVDPFQLFEGFVASHLHPDASLNWYSEHLSRNERL